MGPRGYQLYKYKYVEAPSIKNDFQDERSSRKKITHGTRYSIRICENLSCEGYNN